MSNHDEAGPGTRTAPRVTATILIGHESGHQRRSLPGDIDAAPGQRIPLAAVGDQPAEDAIVISNDGISTAGDQPVRMLRVMLDPSD